MRIESCSSSTDLYTVTSSFPDETQWKNFDEFITSLKSFPLDRDAYTPLHVAAALGLESEFERLIQEGAAINTSVAANGGSFSPLHFAAFRGMNGLIFKYYYALTKERQTEILISLTRVRDDPSYSSLFEELWNNYASLEEKAAAIGIDSDKKLFEQAPLELQIQVLIFLLRFIADKKDIQPFLDLWNCLSEEQKSYDHVIGKSIIDEILAKASIFDLENLILYLMENGHNFYYVSRENASPPHKVGRVNPFTGSSQELLKKTAKDIIQDMKICRLFGHMFSLRGKLFEGAKSSFIEKAFVSLLQSYTSYLRCCENSSLPHPIQTSTSFDEIIQVFSNCMTNDPELLTKMSQKKWALVQSGYRNHSAYHIITPQVVVYIDTATKRSRSGVHSLGAICFYKIENLDPQTRLSAAQGFVQSCIQNKKKEKDAKPWFNLRRKLDLQLVYFVKHPQRSKNCCWEAIKGAYLALLILNQSPSAFTVHEMSLLEIKARLNLQAFLERECVETIKRVYEVFPKYPNLFNIQEIFTQVITHCINEGLENPVKEILDREPSLRS